jgi:hypothetical protein
MSALLFFAPKLAQSVGTWHLCAPCTERLHFCTTYSCRQFASIKNSLLCSKLSYQLLLNVSLCITIDAEDFGKDVQRKAERATDKASRNLDNATSKAAKNLDNVQHDAERSFDKATRQAQDAGKDARDNLSEAGKLTHT